MNTWKIGIQNLKFKPLYTFLSVFILSLSIALLLGVQQLKMSFQYQMDNNLGEIDMVIGAKGSPLQLVLASVLHLDNPTGNILYKEAKEIGKNPMIKLAVPISYGDNFKGYRIVGTTQEFTAFYKAELQRGHFVKKTMEVVLGNLVSKKLNLNIGDTFLSSHGFVENDINIHHEEFTVVGILKPTQKVIDRLILTNLESVWDVHHHEEEEDHVTHHHKNEEHTKEITSLLLNFRNPSALLTLPRKINKQTNMQAVLPKYELDKLYEYTGVGFETISWIAYLILIISGMTIFISLYKMTKERAFDLALLRTYGASNFQLIKMVAYEGLTIGFFAFIVGFLLAKTGLYIMFTRFVKNRYLLSTLQELSYNDVLQTGSLIFVLVISSILLATYPIVKMNISTILSNEK